ncbi:MAG: hypothetical protein EXS05_13100 [Planctomycetaceae bacterium]|nr:hypothetical protein [Planctomycetaceae bacterium]
MMRFQAESCGGRCLRLAYAALGVWLLALVPAFYWFGADGIGAATVSAVVCLIPGCLVFWLVAAASPPNAQVRAVVLGTGLRVASGLAGAFVMHNVLALAPKNYVVWLTIFYLVTLLVETCLIMPARVRSG